MAVYALGKVVLVKPIVGDARDLEALAWRERLVLEREVAVLAMVVKGCIWFHDAFMADVDVLVVIHDDRVPEGGVFQGPDLVLEEGEHDEVEDAEGGLAAGHGLPVDVGFVRAGPERLVEHHVAELVVAGLDAVGLGLAIPFALHGHARVAALEAEHAAGMAVGDHGHENLVERPFDALDQVGL